MKKIPIFFCTLLTISCVAQKKLYAKGNALFAPLGMINLGLEQELSEHYTLQADGFISPWKSFDGKYMQAAMLGVDLRYYFDKSFKHWYIGANISSSIYKFQKWNYWSDKPFQLDENSPVYTSSNLYQTGYSVMIGATVGYQFQINDKWNVDIFLGGGNSQGLYKGYDKITGERYDGEEGWNKSGEWIPYRGGVMIAYKLK
jgi:hypothetical protein